jgi:hypothetical protein
MNGCQRRSKNRPASTSGSMSRQASIIHSLSADARSLKKACALSRYREVICLERADADPIRRECVVNICRAFRRWQRMKRIQTDESWAVEMWMVAAWLVFLFFVVFPWVLRQGE